MSIITNNNNNLVDEFEAINLNKTVQRINVVELRMKDFEVQGVSRPISDTYNIVRGMVAMSELNCSDEFKFECNIFFEDINESYNYNLKSHHNVLSMKQTNLNGNPKGRVITPIYCKPGCKEYTCIMNFDREFKIAGVDKMSDSVRNMFNYLYAITYVIDGVKSKKNTISYSLNINSKIETYETTMYKNEKGEIEMFQRNVAGKGARCITIN